MGLLLLSASLVPSQARGAESAPPIRFNVSAFDVDGPNPLSAAETESLLSPFLGEHEGLEALLEAATELESAILAEGHSFHRVILPPQTLEEGVINLKVVVYKLANVEVTGNEYFSPENIISSLPGLEKGTAPDTTELARELIIANNHPSKEVTIRMKHSRVPDSVDAELVVKDERPWRFFTGLNNIGVDQTGEFRWSAGYQHTNLLDLDDSLTLSYTTSPGHWDDVKQWGANYRLPLYELSGALAFYYSRSDVNNGTVAEVFDVSGAGKFVGGSFTYTLRNRDNYRHRVFFGVDDKLFENNIDFQGVALGVDVRSRPLTLGYSGEWRLEKAGINFQVSYLRNLPGGDRNEGAVYRAARLGAKQSWEAIRLSAAGSYALPKNWMATFSFNAQYTDEALISGEQFGPGGMNSVRGFEERGTTGDRGMKLSVEALTPEIKYNLRLLAFMDMGHVKILNTAPGQISSDTILSMGLGARWRWNDKLSASFDYGHSVEGAELPNAGGVKAHFAVYYRF